MAPERTDPIMAFVPSSDPFLNFFSSPAVAGQSILSVVGLGWKNDITGCSHHPHYDGKHNQYDQGDRHQYITLLINQDFQYFYQRHKYRAGRGYQPCWRNLQGKCKWLCRKRSGWSPLFDRHAISTTAGMDGFAIQLQFRYLPTYSRLIS